MLTKNTKWRGKAVTAPCNIKIRSRDIEWLIIPSQIIIDCTSDWQVLIVPLWGSNNWTNKVYLKLALALGIVRECALDLVVKAVPIAADIIFTYSPERFFGFSNRRLLFRGYTVWFACGNWCIVSSIVLLYCVVYCHVVLLCFGVKLCKLLEELPRTVATEIITVEC